jgi:hypothetical protein
VRIAAILSLSDDHHGSGEIGELGKSSLQPALQSAENISPIHSELLGQSLLDRALAKLTHFGVTQYATVSEDIAGQLFASRTPSSRSFIDTWERIVSRYVEEGVELLLFLRVNAYCDLDYMQLLRFHLETESPVTQAYASDGPLDVVLLDASRLRGRDAAYWRSLNSLISRPARFLYRGYVNRLGRPQDFYALINDGLRGRCGLRPVGTETGEWVWQGADVHVDRSAVITGPVFIGAGSMIGACCTIIGGSSIEHQCEVDCGTVVEQSWVTQNTYLGVALDVRRAIVGPSTLFHLDRNVEVQIGDRHLVGAAIKSPGVFAGLGSLLWGESRAAN